MATKLNKVGKKERVDLDMTMGLIGNSLLSDKGLEQMKSMMGAAKDPSAVLGQLVYHAVGGARDQMEARGLKVSPKIWVARGGVVDQTVAEAAKVVAGIGNSPQILNRNVLEAAREQVLEAMHHEDRSKGMPGNPDHPDNQTDADDQSGNEEQAYEGTPADDNADNEYQSTMPPAEAGGSHGPNRMPAPTGLMAGG